MNGINQKSTSKTLAAVLFGYRLYKIFGIKSLLLYSRFVKIKELEKIVGKVMLDVNYDSSFFPDIKFHGLFRARAHNNLKGSLRNGRVKNFNKESAFKNPPSSKVNRGRCNDHGESMFYSSNELFTSIVESRPRVNEYVTVAVYENLYDGKLFEHRISPVGYRYLRKIPTLTQMMIKMNPDNRKGFTQVDDFLDKLFHRKIKKNAHYYKLSNAVTNCMMKDIINDAGTVLRQHGLIYSSILRNKRSFNVVLKPFYVNYYKIVELYTFQILEYNRKELRLKLLRLGELDGTKTDPAQDLGISWRTLSLQQQEIKEFKF